MAKGPDWNDVHRVKPGTVRDALTEPDIPFDDAPPQPNGEACSTEEKLRRQEPRIIAFTPYVWRAPATIPMRQWLYGKHYIRKFLSATLAAGGLGKSSLDLVEAIAMAAMLNLLGVPVPDRLRVAYWGEDPADEIERRVAAILLHFKISREQIEGWLFVDSFRNQPLRVASLEKGEIVFPDAVALTKALIESRIDVLILDPFVKTHGVSENDNAAIDQVARKFNDIAESADWFRRGAAIRGKAADPAAGRDHPMARHVDDPLEHEADRVADQVMRMPAPEVSVAAAPPQLSRKCSACEEEEKLQKKEAGPQAAAGEAPAIVHEVLRSPGQPLDVATRAYFEPRFGHDFSQVRVHSDQFAARSVEAVAARAYTVGSDVVFGAGRYVPDSRDGQRLLAHELAHVVQQLRLGRDSFSSTVRGR